jgi:hypothetical protein
VRRKKIWRRREERIGLREDDGIRKEKERRRI